MNQCRKVLLLNADYRPLSVVSWRKALSLLVQDKAQVIEEYGDWTVSSASHTFNIPSILALDQYISFRRKITFNRMNVYSRDSYTCQYCSKSLSENKIKISDLTFDHVIPRVQGGLTSWDNIVTACRPCNTKKGGNTPEEAKMPLLRKPLEPSKTSPLAFYLKRKTFPESWRNYLSIKDEAVD